MAKEQVIVKRLGAIHDLGSMDVLCTDKTGTLTEARIRLARQVALSGDASEHVGELAWLNSHFEAGLRNPLDAAIVESGPARDAGWAKIDEVPFDFQRRRVSVLVEHEGRRLLITKGAPEDVIRHSVQYEEPGKPGLLPLDDAARARAANVFEGLSAEGLRALGVAWRGVRPRPRRMPMWPTSRNWFLPGSSFSMTRPKPAPGRPSPRWRPTVSGSRSSAATTSG